MAEATTSFLLTFLMMGFEAPAGKEKGGMGEGAGEGEGRRTHASSGLCRT